MTFIRPITHKMSILVTLFVMTLFTHVASASLLNADFSGGFEKWQGEVSIDGSASISGINPADYTENYSYSTDSATLLTNYDGGEIWQAVLYQDFSLPLLSSDSSLWISLNVAYALTSVNDFVFAQLRTQDYSMVLDLLPGGSFDISSWTGRDVSLEFGVEDADFNLGDSLTVSDLAIEQNSNEIPESSTILLLATGLLALRKKKKSHLSALQP